MSNINQGSGPIDASALERELAAAKGGKRVGGGSGGFVGKSTKGLVVTQKDLPKEVDGKPSSGVTTFRVLPQMTDMTMPWVRYDEHFMFNESNRAWASFNCLGAETKAITREHGLVGLYEIVGESLHFLQRDGSWSQGTVREFGIQKLNMITMIPRVLRDDGKSGGGITNARRQVRATADHRWILSGGEEVTELKPGMLVRSQTYKAIRDGEQYRAGMQHGIVFGDGTRDRINSDGIAVFQTRLCGEKTSLSSYFLQVTQPPSFGDDLLGTVRTASDLKALPTSADPEYIAGFIDGWLATDGCMTGPQKILSTQNLEAANWMESHAPYAGYIVTGRAVNTRPTNYGDRSSPLINLTINSGKVAWKVVSIEELPEAETVYCAVVPEGGSFCLEGGIYTGNCFWRMSDGKEQCEGCDLISQINRAVVWPLEKMSKDEATEYMKRHPEHRGAVKFAGGSKAKTHIAMNVVFTSWGGGPVPTQYQGVRVLKVGAGIWKGTAKGVIGGMVAILQKYPNLTDPHEGPEIKIVKSGEGLDTSYPVTVVESRQLVDVGGRKMELEVPKLTAIASTEGEIQSLLDARAGLSIFLKMKTHDEALSALQAVNTFIDPSTLTAKAPQYTSTGHSTAATYTAPRTAQSDLETEFAGGPADDEDADKLPW